jgi:hypothetical protein
MLNSSITEKQNQIGINAIKIMLLELYQDKPEILINKTERTLIRMGLDNVTAHKIATKSIKTYFKNL